MKIIWEDDVSFFVIRSAIEGSRPMSYEQYVFSETMTGALHFKTDTRNEKKFLGFCFVAISTASSPHAHAQVNSQVLRPNASLGVSYDSNVLGLSSPEAALAETGTRRLSDVSETALVGVDYEQRFGQQRVSANVSASRTQFSRLSRLDYRGENLGVDWAWHLGNYWEGTAGYTRTVTLAPFTDFHGLESNTNTTQRRYVSFAWKIHPSWRLKGEVTRFGIDYSLLAQSQYDRFENQGVFAVDYATGAGNVIGLQWKVAEGHLPNQLLGPDALPNDYRQQQVALKGNWQLTGKTRVDFTGGLVSRAHAVYAERNFRGYNGRTTVAMALSGMTLLTLSAWRETGIFDDLSTAYSTNRGVNLGARWLPTAAISVEGSVKREYRDFTRSLQYTMLPNYRDILSTNQVLLNYRKSRHFSLQLVLFDSRKNNSGRIGEYDRRGATMNARYEY